MVPWCGNGLRLIVIAALLGSCAPSTSSLSSPADPPPPAPETTANLQPVVSAEAPATVTNAPVNDPMVLAATPAASKVLFACRTAENKVIELYDGDAVIQYVFGPQGQPELVLEVPRAQASTFQWHGIGRYENYSVSIPNGSTVYSVFWSRDRLDMNQRPEGGVTVEIDGAYVATVDCVTEITNNLIGLDLPPTPL